MTQHPASVAYVDGMRVWQSFGTYVHVLTGNFSHLFVPEYCTMQCMMRLPTGDDLIEHVVPSWMVDFVVKQMSAAGRTPSFCSANGLGHNSNICMDLPYYSTCAFSWALKFYRLKKL
jgi:hypothetical protein